LEERSTEAVRSVHHDHPLGNLAMSLYMLVELLHHADRPAHRFCAGLAACVPGVLTKTLSWIHLLPARKHPSSL
jgi:hypothetical protein